jgi:hypothetical protein
MIPFHSTVAMSLNATGIGTPVLQVFAAMS